MSLLGRNLDNVTHGAAELLEGNAHFPALLSVVFAPKCCVVHGLIEKVIDRLRSRLSRRMLDRVSTAH